MSDNNFPDDLIEVARKTTWESGQRNISLRDMKYAEKFASEQIQKQTIEGIGFSEGSGRVRKAMQNEAFKYLSVQEDGSYSFMSQMGYPDDVTVGTSYPVCCGILAEIEISVEVQSVENSDMS